jgi:ferredoxin
MPRVRYQQSSKLCTIEVEVPIGDNLMIAAIGSDVPGIIGECGGNALCGTCLVRVEDAFIDRLQPPGEEEMTLLDVVADNERGCRLGCQIIMTDELDGLTVTVPDGK